MDKSKHPSSTRVARHRWCVCVRIWVTDTPSGVWFWPGSWDDSTIECLCPQPRPCRAPSQPTDFSRCGLCCRGLHSEAPSRFSLSLSLCVFVVPSCTGSTWQVFRPSHRNVSKCWILSSISCITKRERETHTQTLLSLHQHSKVRCVRVEHLRGTVSVLLGDFPQQTTAFTMINDVKWSKAVLEWNRRFFSAWKQQSLTLTKSEQSQRKRDGC